MLQRMPGLSLCAVRDLPSHAGTEPRARTAVMLRIAAAQHARERSTARGCCDAEDLFAWLEGICLA